MYFNRISYEAKIKTITYIVFVYMRSFFFSSLFSSLLKKYFAWDLLIYSNFIFKYASFGC